MITASSVEWKRVLDMDGEQCRLALLRLLELEQPPRSRFDSDDSHTFLTDGWDLRREQALETIFTTD